MFFQSPRGFINTYNQVFGMSFSKGGSAVPGAAKGVKYNSARCRNQRSRDGFVCLHVMWRKLSAEGGLQVAANNIGQVGVYLVLVADDWLRIGLQTCQLPSAGEL